MSEKTYNISKNSARKSASDGDRLRPVCIFLEILKFQKEKKICSNFSLFKIFVKCDQNMVKLLIQELLVLLNNYSRILVLLNNYFSFFIFGQMWSNCGQTTYSRNISVTK